MSGRVVILVGGGDVPGLNMCLKSLVYRVIDLGFEPLGVRKGWEGLIRYNPQDPTSFGENLVELNKSMVRPIDRTAGSFLHSSRLEPRKTPRRFVPEFLREAEAETQNLAPHIMEAIRRLNCEGVIVIGDDDTLHCAAHLSQEGMPIIAIPKTIHNNILGTDYSLGFSTGLARGVAFIHELRALAASREQIIVVETFAAGSGYSTLLMALLAGVDRVLIPEVPYDPEKLGQLALTDKSNTPANYAVVTVCGGSRLQADKTETYRPLLEKIRSQERSWNGGSPIGSGFVATELLSFVTGEEVFLQPLTFLLRTGPPDGQDLLGAANFAFAAAHLLAEGKFGRMVAFRKEEMWTDVDLGLAKEGVKTVDVDSLYDVDTYQPRLSMIWSAQ